MAKNIFNKYIGAFAIGAVIMAVPSCSDDHFAIEDNGQNNSASTATQSLWDVISNNPNLSKFAAIAEKAKYWKDEKHEVSNYTFADILKSGQVCTVWAPENDYISDTQYKELLEMCETDGYAVQQQFLGNHIALWRRNISEAGVDTIKMLNGKNIIFDKTDSSIQGIGIDKENTPALNGTLHTIKGTTPFNYNFYEYIKYSGKLPILADYIIAKDTTYFSQDRSIEGLPDENGNPTYVDSVYVTSNQLFTRKSYLPNAGAENWEMAEEAFAARINVEDSSFVMILPTDAAWTTAKEKMAHLYKYAPIYEDKEKGNLNSTAYRKDYDPDSLSKMSLEMDLITPLVYNMNKQPKVGGTSGPLWKADKFVETKGDEAEYFLNTFGDTLRSTDTWNKTELFNGNLVKMSNGYGYEVEEWAFPTNFYAPDVEVEVNGWFYNSQSTTYCKVGNSQKNQPFNNETYAEISKVYGEVSKNNFYYIPGTGATSAPKVEIPLKGNLNTAYVPNAEVMSGKYDIQVVIVPLWYKTISDKAAIDSIYLDSIKVDSISKISRQAFTYQIRYCNGDAKGKDAITKKSSVFYSEGNKVDTITVATDFEFPYSYKNMRFTYPTIVIEGAGSSKLKKEGVDFPLCIDQIILRSKETDEELDLEQ